MTKLARMDANQVREIAVDELLLSPEETRRTIDQAALQELANSICANGVIEPLLVRVLPIERWKDLSDDFVSVHSSATLFEIVAGQRRWLASKLAGKATCPCVVRELTDDEARERRVISNLQREDLAPMEEAEAYGKLLERPGATIESVAAALAKSPSYVARRLKLLDAIEPVRKALRLGAIEIGHALELARLSQGQQEALLEWLRIGYDAPDEDKDDEDDDREKPDLEPGTCAYCGDSEDELKDDGRTWANPERTVCGEVDCVAEARRDGVIDGFLATRTTVAELRNRIARTELRVLRDVPFPLNDEIPPMACAVCPKRAAGASSLFADIAEDTCTDPACLEAKLRTWVKAKLYEADQAGNKLVALYDGHASEKAGVSRWDCVVEAECASQEKAIWVSGSRIGHFVQICRDKKCAEHGGGSAASGSGTRGGVAKPAAAKQSAEEKRRVEAQKAERAKLAEKVTKEREYRARLFAAIAQVPDAQIDAPRVDLLTKQACFKVLQSVGQYGADIAPALGIDSSLFGYSEVEKLGLQMRGWTVQAALRAAALGLVVNQLAVGEYDIQSGREAERMEQVAGWLGIDVKAVRSGKPAAEQKSAVIKKAAVKKVAKPAKKQPAKKSTKKGGRK